MISKILSPGDRLEVKKIVSEKKRRELEEENSIFAKTLISKIYDIIDETQLKIAMPMAEGRIIPLPVNSRFDVCFFSSGGLYSSAFTVIERYKENGLYILVVELIYELKKVQRRQYYRLDCVMEIEYVKVEEEFVNQELDELVLEEKFAELEKFNGIVMDISGGGIRFASEEELPKNSMVIVKLNLEFGKDQKIFGVLGKVLSSKKVRNNQGMYEQRIEYFEMQAKIREKIIRYIFEQERRLRNKI